MKRKSFHIWVFLLAFMWLIFPAEVKADDVPVVVIDPGHGGENLGAIPEGYVEKEITMIVAQAMYEELSKYEGIEVYLTRDGDEDLTLAERAGIAAEKEADMLISLHFNMSEYHTLFGSEVWVSAFGENYQEGYALGDAFLKQFEKNGMFRKEIKTRLNSDGEDYYGVIRESVALGVNAVLVEHCYLDHENDASFRENESDFVQLGKMDATAVAQYYGLSSAELGVDYSDYQNAYVPLPKSVVKPDETPADICYIELVNADKETRNIQISLSAEDYDTGMLFYSYSYDGGETFSALRAWPENADTFQFVIEVPNGIMPHIVVTAYNKYDVPAVSNEIVMEGFPLVSEGYEKESTEAATQESVVAEEFSEVEVFQNAEEQTQEQTKEDSSFSLFLKISAICIGILFILLIIGYSYIEGKRKRKRRKF